MCPVCTLITSASLKDPKSGNTAVVNGSGVQITTGTGTSSAQTSQGIFISGSPAANNLQGSGALKGFTFDINRNCDGTCLASGTFSYNGTPDQTRDLLDSRGAFRSIVDQTLPGVGKSVDEMEYHPNTTQHRFGDTPSPHFSVPRDPRDTVPTVGPFHVDTNAPGLKHLGCATLGIGCN